MELTSLVSGMTEFAANLYPLKTEEELVALLSGMHHFPPGVPERARRVHERLPAGSALCSSDVGVLIGRLDTEGGLGGLYKHLAHTKEGPLHLVPSITHCAVCALNGEQVPLVVKSSLGNAFPRPTVYLDGRGGVRESVLYASGARAAMPNTTCHTPKGVRSCSGASSWLTRARCSGTTDLCSFRATLSSRRRSWSASPRRWCTRTLATRRLRPSTPSLRTFRQPWRMLCR